MKERQLIAKGCRNYLDGLKFNNGAIFCLKIDLDFRRKKNKIESQVGWLKGC